VAPTATINIIRNFAVVKKFKVTPPDVIRGRFKCKNPTCVTNAPREPVEPTFYLVRREPPLFICAYCGRYHELGDLL